MGGGMKRRIVKTPGVCGGRTRIAGHRVRVLDIVQWHEHQGMTADEIALHVPTITPADIHAALAYYFDHMAEIQEEMRAERAVANQFRRSQSSLLTNKLRRDVVREAS